MLKYLLECIDCSAICHFPLDSDQLRKAETRNIEQKYREEKIPLCFERRRPIKLRHSWKYRAQNSASCKSFRLGLVRLGLVRFSLVWLGLVRLGSFPSTTFLFAENETGNNWDFFRRADLLPRGRLRNASRCIQRAHNILFINNSFAKSVNFRCRGVVHENSNWTLAQKNTNKKQTNIIIISVCGRLGYNKGHS